MLADINIAIVRSFKIQYTLCTQQKTYTWNEKNSTAQQKIARVLSSTFVAITLVFFVLSFIEISRLFSLES